MLSKLTKQEMTLIISLLTIIIWVAGIMLVIKPNIEANSEMKEKLESAEFRKDEVDRKLASEPTIKENIANVRTEMYKTLDSFFSATENYDVDQYIMPYLVSNGLTIKSMAIADANVSTLDYYNYFESQLLYPLGDYAKSQRTGKDVGGTISTDTPTDPTGTTNAVTVNESCEKSIVTVQVQGTQQQIRNFINGISNDEKTLLVTNVTSTGNAGVWLGNITIEFIAVDKYEG